SNRPKSTSTRPPHPFPPTHRRSPSVFSFAGKRRPSELHKSTSIPFDTQDPCSLRVPSSGSSVVLVYFPTATISHLKSAKRQLILGAEEEEEETKINFERTPSLL